MAYNEVVTGPGESSAYGTPPESCAEECQELCKGKTVNELYQIADYFRKEGDDLDKKVDSTITSDDFEKAKVDKEDMTAPEDHDGEEFESTY